ncbi:MAG: helix-turn-helix transcriptional regulator [Syntrophotalea acetylenica]|jgi:transcriptional regulator with XRE-family HTH domain|uniref:HTH cro/C1-type domain-containing protein n=1 Tax=Syntrophotalea acetylenica TaxID=29542 RepID=A0A1L3GD52_SYNAC|nr:helix-turn-helix transcriptional regulator [Syntrophotalea acetylenica]APG23866.1 hypothetical protein A7E75_01625 [Syntrophotalea acetylenica]APG44448.1 hypothetical protein A6070_10240 [Syntrophotalea acetylenica]MDD4458151.1 helix-turn-helix transcriptional regulator [Syntrophotalea acetylenica]
MENLIGSEIKKRREALKMTQSELGKALGYRYGNFIGYLENGRAAFPLEKWEEYAEVLQIPKYEFLELIFKERFPGMLAYIDFHPASQSAKKEAEDKISNI